MMGEQKHKVFKTHAVHTNSKENDLQLLKSVNLSQALRFIIDGTYQESAPWITSQVQAIINQCPTLRDKFIGVSSGVEPEDIKEASIDHSSSVLHLCTTGKPIPLRHIPRRNQELTINLVTKAYYGEYGVGLHVGMA